MMEKTVEMAINSSGIRETAHMLKINKNTVINRLKTNHKFDSLPRFKTRAHPAPLITQSGDFNLKTDSRCLYQSHHNL